MEDAERGACLPLDRPEQIGYREERGKRGIVQVVYESRTGGRQRDGGAFASDEGSMLHRSKPDYSRLLQAWRAKGGASGTEDLRKMSRRSQRQRQHDGPGERLEGSGSTWKHDRQFGSAGEVHGRNTGGNDEQACRYAACDVYTSSRQELHYAVGAKRARSKRQR